jgi:hypothetical protein
MRRQLLSKGSRRYFPSYESFQRCFLSHKISKSSSVVDDAASTTAPRDKLLRAPFQRVANAKPPLFPWRHSEEVLPRLIPGSQEFEEQGYLLGGNVFSSNPTFDNYATAKFFLDVPWYKMIFFKDWQDDLAESMSWAFAQGTAGIMSNVYRGKSSCIADVRNSLLGLILMRSFSEYYSAF